MVEVRLTIPHYFPTPTGAPLDSADAWDEIRQVDAAFALPPTRNAWVAQADARPELRQRADVVADVAADLGVHVVASYGVGTGLLEYHLSKRVRRMVSGDYAPSTTEQLATIAPELDPVVHDLSIDGPLPADLHVMHRVDTEFTNAQWRDILRRFDAPVLLVISERLEISGVWRELRCRLRGGKRAGWLRTMATVRTWVPHHMTATDLQVADLPGLLLHPHGRSGVHG